MTITSVERTIRVRIHERGTTVPADGTVEYTLGHDRLATIPPFGGQTVRATEGRTEQKPYWLDVIDVDGEFTAVLAVSGRPVMLGRILEVQLSTDGGAYATVDTRRLSNLQSGPEGRYRLEASDERWVEKPAKLFERTTSVQFDPPGRAVAWLDKPAEGEREYLVEVVGANHVALAPSGIGHADVPPMVVATLVNDLLEERSVTGGSFESLRFRVSSTDRPVLCFDADLDDVAQRGLEPQLDTPLGYFLSEREGEASFWMTVFVYWPAHGLSSGNRVTGRLYWSTGIVTTEETPYLIGGADGIRAPDLLEEIAAGDHGGPVERASASAFAALTGDVYPPAWYKLTESKARDEWPREQLMNPYGIVPLVDGTGLLAPRSVRPPQDVDPDTLYEFDKSTTLEGPSWRHPSGEAITVVAFECRVVMPFLPVLGLLPFSRRREHDTVAEFGIQKRTFKLDAIFLWQHAIGVFEGLTQDLFDRFGDAPQRGEIVGPIDAAAPVPGELVKLNQDDLHGPNPATDARSGSRIVHITERQRVYEEGGRAVYDYAYLDAGPAVQPLATPAVSVVQNAGNPKHAVDVTVSSVPAGATAIVQVAHGSSPAAADWLTARTGVGNETITIPNRPSGTQINVRAIATAPSKTRSAASIVDDVTTAAMTAPSAVVATASGRSVKVVATLGETIYAVEYLIDGTIEKLLPARSSEYTFHALAASTLFTFGVRHRDPYGGLSSITTDTETTGTALDSPDMKAFSVVPVLIEDDDPVVPLDEPQELTGVVAQMRFLVGDPAFLIVVERAPDETPTAPDVSELVVVARLPGSTRSHRDPRPANGDRLWYRAYQARDGWNDGDPTGWIAVDFTDLDQGDTDPQTVGDDDVLRVKRSMPFDDGLYAPRAVDTSGVILASDVLQTDGVANRQLIKGRQNGTGQDGDPVTFGQIYQDPPMDFVRGGAWLEPDSAQWSTPGSFSSTKRQYPVLKLTDLTASGGVIKAELYQKGSPSQETDTFAAGTIVAIGSGNAINCNLDPGGSVDDKHTVRFDVDITLDSPGESGTARVTVVIRSNDGVAGWVTRKTVNYQVDLNGTSSKTWSDEDHEISVSGLGLNDDIEVYVSAINSSGGLLDSDWSFTVDPESVRYLIDGSAITASMTPDAEDEVEWRTVAAA